MNTTVAIVARTARFSLLRYVPVGPMTGGGSVTDRSVGLTPATSRGVWHL